MVDDTPAEQAEIEKLRARDPGEADDEVYEDVDIAALPGWWRRAIEEFEEHDLRPYRPPRFSDGTLKHVVVDRLESRYDVTFRFIGMNVSYGDDWEVYVDGNRIGTIGRHRSPHGYTIFEMESDEFVSWVTEAIGTERE
ncbi:hypothetical protein ACFR97_13465 [Haloplanus litoreus]|uniref:Uncharacterized protein n=1 Tax=Haloplanus litoreus TaxID=767515 RepID=A0ABD6A254_9EURY